MEQKDIRYKGFSTLPDDYQCADGAIAFATNVVFEDGGIRTIPEEKRLPLVVGDDAKVFIHHTSVFCHYIIAYQAADGVLLFYIDSEEMDEYVADQTDKGGDTAVRCIYGYGQTPTETLTRQADFTYTIVHGVGGTYNYEKDTYNNIYAGEFVSLVATGNTLVLSTSTATHYIICRPGTADAVAGVDCAHPYTYLGTQVPTVDIEFALDLTLVNRYYGNLGLSMVNSITEADFSVNTPISAVSYYCPTKNYNQQFYFEGATLTKGQSYAVMQNSRSAAEKVNYIYVRGKIEGADELSVIAGFDAKYLAVQFQAEENYSEVCIEIHNKKEVSGIVTLLEVNPVPAVEDGDLYFAPYTEENYEALMGCINKFVEENGREKNKFIHPFFVRYAVEMYDESACQLSPPILMIPNSGYAPFVRCDTDENADSFWLYAFVGELQYRFNKGIGEEWKDIIQGVKIYVSPSVYPYNQGKNFSEEESLFNYIVQGVVNNTPVNDTLPGLSYGYGKIKRENGQDLSDGYYTIADLYTFADRYFALGSNADNGTDAVIIYQAAPREKDEIDEDIKNVSSFYFVKRINLQDIEEEEYFETLEMESGVLSGLEGRESLVESEVQYSGYSGSGVFDYNKRLHIYGGKKFYKDLVCPPKQNHYINYVAVDGDEIYGGLVGEETDTVTRAAGENLTQLHGFFFYRAWTYINSEQGDIVVLTEYDEGLQYLPGDVWIFYPNNRAYKVVVEYAMDGDQGSHRYAAFPLEMHNYLNGAYFFLDTAYGMNEIYQLGNYDLSADEIAALPAESVAAPMDAILVSEVSNPFVFNNVNNVTAGSGNVLALAAATMALSQDQFGTYPLYVFTDEGLWALSVNDDGTYGTSLPISRDVVTNIDSITSLDTAVWFVTDRGIMQAAERSVACITDGIDGDFGQFDPTDLPGFVSIAAAYLEITEDELTDKVKKWASSRFFDFIKTCRMAYDYTHSRVIVYNTDNPIAYNYSLQSGEWAMMLSSFTATVDAYPDCLVLETETDDTRRLASLSEYADGALDARRPFLFISRPFKLDAPDVFKTVYQIVQRGFFRQAADENHIIGTVLYGSPDLFNWFGIAQSARAQIADSNLYTAAHRIDNIGGTPYKYFRVLVLADATAKENICGCTLRFDIRDNNQLR